MCVCVCVCVCVCRYVYLYRYMPTSVSVSEHGAKSLKQWQLDEGVEEEKTLLERWIYLGRAKPHSKPITGLCDYPRVAFWGAHSLTLLAAVVMLQGLTSP